MMAANKAVSVLTPNGRRQIVRVSPNTSLLQVLEEVCMKHGFDPDDHGLRFQRNLLDLSLQWRFASLPNNAKLEVVPSNRRQTVTDNTVLIAVQLEDGNRLQGAFSCGQSLWELLSHFPELSISDEDEDSTPTCVYMRDEITGQQTLQSTTLKSLGLTGGSAIIRYMLKKPKRTEDGNSNESAVFPTDGVIMESSEHLASQFVLPLPSGDNVADDMAEETTSSPSMSMEPCVSANLCYVQARKDEMSSGFDSQALRSRNQVEEKQREQDLEKTPHAEQHKDEPRSSRECKISNQIPARSTFVPFSGGGQCLGGTGISKSVSSSLTVGPPDAKKPKSSHEIKNLACVKASDGQGFGRQDTDIEEPVEDIDRKSLVYHLDAGVHVDADQELPDEFFEVTVDDVRKRFSQLKSQRRLLEEAPLMTQALREARMKEKVERYPFVVLRVQFPDRYVLQGFFRPQEKVTAVREFVKTHLEDPNISFYLFITPPKSILEDSTTLFQANLFPAALIYFGSDVKTDCFLQREILESSVCAQQADELIAGCISKSSVPSSGLITSQDSCPLPAMSSAATSHQETELLPQAPRPVVTDPTKIPKWLKLPGKK
ncbi:tether containing UBX domain for GLUT4 isoform X1 [Alosa sapidissima]|uniref:tether containing UBX domain for GLUT4 isoform X1 n=2 Tax=Alosa sapidissima TaxID=34773 RepID=UPI001C09FBFF|nr:tether containing UBX domain for GLUT4 isoform X1 [Alosa sapidissima]